MYYFDYAATTKIDERVLEIYNKISKNFFLHPQNDKQTLSLLNESRDKILTSLNLPLQKYEVVYTTSATEANNLAILGHAKTFTTPKHFITTKIEHPSVYETFKFLETQNHKVTFLDVDSEGMIDVKELERAITEDTVLISIMYVNNEVGSIQDIEQIYKVIKRENPNIIFMSDIVQAVGKIYANYNYIDMMSISSHKLKGPKSVGCLIKRKDIPLVPITYGGYSANKYRTGTESLALQIAFSYALNFSVNNLQEKVEKIEDNVNYLISLLAGNEKIEINNYSKSGIVNVNLNIRALAETMMSVLSEKDIYVSTKSACSSKTNTKSRVLEAIDIPDEKIDKSLRISVSDETTKEQIDYLVTNLQEIVEKM